MISSRRDFILGGASAAIAGAVTGCHTPPTPEAGTLIGRGFGSATGLVLDQCGLDSESRNAIIGVVGEISRCAPQDGESVTDAWTRVAGDHVAKLVTDGKLTKAQAGVVIAAFSLVVRGWKLVEERHPEAKAWCDFTFSTVGGFCEGLLATYRPDNANGCDDCTVNVSAYRSLRACVEARQLRASSVRAARASRVR